MGTEVVVFLKVFFQDYCRLLGLPRRKGNKVTGERGNPKVSGISWKHTSVDDETGKPVAPSA